jgi:hypothetical protein
MQAKLEGCFCNCGCAAKKGAEAFAPTPLSFLDLSLLESQRFQESLQASRPPMRSASTRLNKALNLLRFARRNIQSGLTSRSTHNSRTRCLWCRFRCTANQRSHSQRILNLQSGEIHLYSRVVTNLSRFAC